MLKWNLSVAYWPECQQAWRSRAGKVSESVVGENCGTWMCSWFQCLSSPSGLMPPIDVVVSCSIWSLTHPFEEKRRMGRVPVAWETMSNNGLGSTDTLGASTGWDIYLTIAACGVGLPQYAPVKLKRCLLTWMSTSLEVEGRESQWVSGWLSTSCPNHINAPSFFQVIWTLAFARPPPRASSSSRVYLASSCIDPTSLQHQPFDPSDDCWLWCWISFEHVKCEAWASRPEPLWVSSCFGIQSCAGPCLFPSSQTNVDVPSINLRCMCHSVLNESTAAWTCLWFQCCSDSLVLMWLATGLCSVVCRWLKWNSPRHRQSFLQLTSVDSGVRLGPCSWDWCVLVTKAVS